MKRGKRAAPRRLAETVQTAPRSMLFGTAGLRQLVGAAILACAVWLLYGRTLDAPFIYDDGATIQHNASIQRLWPLIDRTGGHGPLNAPAETPVHGRPLVNLSFAVNYHFGQLDPRGYRAVNIALHVLSAILLWAVVRRTLGQEVFQGRFAHTAEPLSFVAALVWALHPLDTECVVYVTQRTELMMGLFYLATFYCCLRYWHAPRQGLRAAWLAAAVAACLPGMLSKETMATAPVMALLYERTFVAGSFRRALRNSWPLYLGLALTWTPLAALNLHGPRTPMAGFNLGVSAHEWWFTQAKIVPLYLKLACWPWPLSIHYEMPYLATFAQAWPWVVLVGLLAAGTLVLLGRRLSAGFVAAFAFAVLSPTLVVPIATEVAAERRMYVPLMALVPLAIVGGYELVRRAMKIAVRRSANFATGNAANAEKRNARAVVAGGLVLALVFGAISARRLSAYQDELTLWQDTEAVMPFSATVQINLAGALERLGRREEAIERYERAVKLAPDFFLGHNNLARALELSGRLPEAQRHYDEVLRLRPDLAAAHYNVARMLEQGGNVPQAQQQLEEALRLYPDFPMAHYALGNLLGNAGQAQQAQEHYEQALQLAPDYPSAHRSLGILLARAGQTEKAIEHFQRVLLLARSVDAYTNLAVAYSKVQRPAEAIAMAHAGAELARRQGNSAEATRLEGWVRSYRGSLSRPASDNAAPGPSPRPQATVPASEAPR